MLEQFIVHIREKNLLDFKLHYLLAVSGGLDSMTLAHLLHQSGISFSMAHCNFGLRGVESDGDETFVREMARRLDVKVYVRKFETKPYSKAMGISTQMAARDLRYKWFEELLEQEGFAGLVVAHHADDQVETVLLNLLRGTGIEGMFGMSDTRDKVIRPLLPFRRSELEAFAWHEGYQWREDRTNQTSDYKRNFLRHQVVPRLKEFDPSALPLLLYSIDRLKDSGRAFFYLYDAWLENNVRNEESLQYLKIESFRSAPGKKSLLFYWLRAFGFNYSQIEDIIISVERQEPGKSFFSKDYILNLDREYLILGLKEAEFQEVWLDEASIELSTGTAIYDVLSFEQDFAPDRSYANATLDREKLSFPLQIRKWEIGDKFRPLGMKNFKKISDFLIDLKVPVIQKRNINVLCSGDDIVWVIGLRIDDRYKISPFTKSALYFKKREDAKSV
jgi:tRNA(Ile)-lysidine synthase